MTALEHAPPVLRICGRCNGRENSDIVGEYAQCGSAFGRPVYRQQGSAAVIRYWPPLRRWLIDCEGRDDDVCAAYAADSMDLSHPAHPELIWYVWEPVAQAHVPDAEVIALSAPGSVTLVGRAGGRENDIVNGQYIFSSVCHGRPVYIHSRGDLGIRYVKEEHRWIIAVLGQDTSCCIAFAEASVFDHPGYVELDWMFWESAHGMFRQDPLTRAVVAPAVVRMLGRQAQAENSRINGSYILAGIMEGRPAYVQPGTRHLIRYSSCADRWLLDPDGLAEPSLASRLYHWIVCGDLVAAGDRCAAYADALQSAHPGISSLEWAVWESRRSCFVLDECVRCTTAPLSVQVHGRALGRENEFINGKYVLSGVSQGRVFYQKPGTQAVIRFWPPRSGWIIDGCGLQNGACSAFADCVPHSEFPGDTCSPWYVYESTRGLHFSDPSVIVIAGGCEREAHCCPDFEEACCAPKDATLRSSILQQHGLYGG